MESIEPRRSVEEQWKNVIQEMNDKTLLPLCDSLWYMGARILRKKREKLNYIGGMDNYEVFCRDGLKDWRPFDVARADGSKGLIMATEISPPR